MSPGLTFERVYAELKRQLREGVHRPGAPLEPTAIGDALGSSMTPIRDALHRLVGEGLVVTPRHNGFAVPRPTEQALRDLYAWNGDVLALLVGRAQARAPEPGAIMTEQEGDTADTTARLFLAIAEATDNREHIRIVAQLNDRLAPYRHVEGQVLAGAVEELATLQALLRVPTRTELSRSLSRYHKRRIAAAPQILSRLHQDS